MHNEGTNHSSPLRGLTSVSSQGSENVKSHLAMVVYQNYCDEGPKVLDDDLKKALKDFFEDNPSLQTKQLSDSILVNLRADFDTFIQVLQSIKEPNLKATDYYGRSLLDIAIDAQLSFENFRRFLNATTFIGPLINIASTDIAPTNRLANLYKQEAAKDTLLCLIELIKRGGIFPSNIEAELVLKHININELNDIDATTKEAIDIYRKKQIISYIFANLQDAQNMRICATKANNISPLDQTILANLQDCCKVVMNLSMAKNNHQLQQDNYVKIVNMIKRWQLPNSNTKLMFDAQALESLSPLFNFCKICINQLHFNKVELSQAIGISVPSEIRLETIKSAIKQVDSQINTSNQIASFGSEPTNFICNYIRELNNKALIIHSLGYGAAMFMLGYLIAAGPIELTIGGFALCSGAVYYNKNKADVDFTDIGKVLKAFLNAKPTHSQVLVVD